MQKTLMQKTLVKSCFNCKSLFREVDHEEDDGRIYAIVNYWCAKTGKDNPVLCSNHDYKEDMNNE